MGLLWEAYNKQVNKSTSSMVNRIHHYFHKKLTHCAYIQTENHSISILYAYTLGNFFSRANLAFRPQKISHKGQKSFFTPLSKGQLLMIQDRNMLSTDSSINWNWKAKKNWTLKPLASHLNNNNLLFLIIIIFFPPNNNNA